MAKRLKIEIEDSGTAPQGKVFLTLRSSDGEDKLRTSISIPIEKGLARTLVMDELDQILRVPGAAVQSR